MTRLDRHVIFEVLRGMVSAFIAVALLVASGILFTYWRDGFERHLLSILLYSLPQVVIFALPVSFFAGMILGVGRIAADRESDIIRGCGIGAAVLYPPLLMLGGLLSAFVLVGWDRAAPSGERHIRTLMRGAAFDVFRGLKDSEERRVVLPDITISFFPATDQGRPVRIVLTSPTGTRYISAEDCHVTISPDGMNAAVQLANGFVTDEGDKNRPRTEFEGLSFDIQGPASSRPNEIINRNELSMRGIIAEVEHIRDLASASQDPAVVAGHQRSARVYIAHLHYELATAFAPFFMVLVAIPLGLMLGSGSRAIGIGAALGYIFVVFYPLLLGGRAIALSGSLHPLLALQLPNIAALVIGAALYLRTKR